MFVKNAGNWHIACIIFLAFQLFPGLRLYGTGAPVDSITRVMATATQPETQYDAVFYLCNYKNLVELDSCLKYSYAARNISRKYKALRGEIYAENTIARAFQYARRIDSSRRHMYYSLQLALNSKNLNTICDEYITLATIYEINFQVDSALFYYMEAKDLAAKSSDHITRANILNQLCEFYTRQKKYEEALAYCTEAYKLRYGKDTFELSGLVSDLGNVYYWKRNYEEALKYYNQALEMSITHHKPMGAAYSLNNIALVYEAKGKFSEAERFYKNSILYYTRLQQHEGMANTLGNLAALFLKKSQPDSALKYGMKAIEEGKKVRALKILQGATGVVSTAFEKKKDYLNALKFIQLSDAYHDSSKNAEIMQRVADIQIGYETKKKEEENKKLIERQFQQSKLISTQRIAGGILLLLLLITLGAGIFVYRSSIKQKKLASELAEQKKLADKAGEFKDRLFSIIAHDFRSPLLSLKLFLSMANDDALSDDEMREMRKSVIQQLNVTSDFMDNILNWAHSQLEGYKPFLRRVKPYAIGTEVISLFKSPSDSKGIELVNEIDPDLEVKSDANLVRMVLRNLVSNSVKFTDHGKIRISSECNGKMLVLKVADTGKGIAGKTMSRLFTGQRYTTLGTENEKGSGLGLMLCREFLMKFNGDLWIESSSNGGTIVSFKVPAEKMTPANFTDELNPLENAYT